jgi:hypothetical protein
MGSMPGSCVAPGNSRRMRRSAAEGGPSSSNTCVSSWLSAAMPTQVNGVSTMHQVIMSDTLAVGMESGNRPESITLAS